MDQGDPAFALMPIEGRRYRLGVEVIDVIEAGYAHSVAIPLEHQGPVDQNVEALSAKGRGHLQGVVVAEYREPRALYLDVAQGLRQQFH